MTKARSQKSETRIRKPDGGRTIHSSCLGLHRWRGNLPGHDARSQPQVRLSQVKKIKYFSRYALSFLHGWAVYPPRDILGIHSPATSRVAAIHTLLRDFKTF